MWKEVYAQAPAAVEPVAVAVSSSWQRIGYEWNNLTVPANTLVRYGLPGRYVEKRISGAFPATNAYFGNDPAPGYRKEVLVETVASVATTASWTAIGSEGQYLNVPPNSTVRYGANGSYVTKPASGGFRASNEFFGSDPAYGVSKQVWLLENR